MFTKSPPKSGLLGQRSLCSWVSNSRLGAHCKPMARRVTQAEKTGPLAGIFSYMWWRVGLLFRWHGWIKECVSSSVFSIHGTPIGFFLQGCGLRLAIGHPPFLLSWSVKLLAKCYKQQQEIQFYSRGSNHSFETRPWPMVHPRFGHFFFFFFHFFPFFFFFHGSAPHSSKP